jgi:hypothetical protein
MSLLTDAKAIAAEADIQRARTTEARFRDIGTDLAALFTEDFGFTATYLHTDTAGRNALYAVAVADVVLALTLDGTYNGRRTYTVMALSVTCATCGELMWATLPYISKTVELGDGRYGLLAAIGKVANKTHTCRSCQTEPCPYCGHKDA